jgi:hypothetical protein
LSDNHVPTTITVIRAPRAFAIRSICRASPTSPAPWKVSATAALSRGPWLISTAGPEGGNRTVGAEPAIMDGGSAVEVVDGVIDDADTPDVAVAAPEAPGVANGSAEGADAVSAACTALPQPASPAMATRNPAPISDRRDRFIHTSSD